MKATAMSADSVDSAFTGHSRGPRRDELGNLVEAQTHFAARVREISRK